MRRVSKRLVDGAIGLILAAGLLLRQGVPPHATYLFKHALLQDAAYSTLLRDPRRALHARIVEVLETQFSESFENQPELIARHCMEAGLSEKAAHFWGKAGHRSLSHSALAEATDQFSRALQRLARLPSTRRRQIEFQVAMIAPLHHTKGYAVPETKSAVWRGLQVDVNQQGLKDPGACQLARPITDPVLLPRGIRISKRRTPVKPIATRLIPDPDSGPPSPGGEPSLRLVAHNYYKFGAAACF